MPISLGAAPTIWASDTNYSSGPNTGTPTRVDPGAGYFAQGWIPGQTVPGQYANFLFGELTDYLASIRSAINGKAFTVDGGTHTLTAKLTIAGNDLQINTQLIIPNGGDIEVENGGDINLLSGADINLNSGAAIEISAGALIAVAGSVHIGASANTDNNTLVVANGGVALVEAGGSVLAQDPDGYLYDEVSMLWRVAPRKGTGPSQWVIDGTSGVPTNTDTSSAFPIYYSPDWNDGDIIDSVTLVVKGGSGHGGSLPSGNDRLSVAIRAYNPSTGVTTTLADRFDQSGSAASYEGMHVLEMSSIAVDNGSMPITIQPNLVYTLVVFSETGVNAQVGAEIRNITGTRRVFNVYGDRI